MTMIFLLIGGESSGKNATLLEYCKIYGYKPKINDSGWEVFKQGKVRIKAHIKGKDILILPKISSPQETVDFCHFEEIISKYLSRFLDSNDAEMSRQKIHDGVIIIAFTVRVENDIVGAKCITEPIEYLKRRGYDILKIYLKREDTEDFKRIDTFMENDLNYDKLILSKKDTGKRQAEELNKFILEKL